MACPPYPGPGALLCILNTLFQAPTKRTMCALPAPTRRIATFPSSVDLETLRMLALHHELREGRNGFLAFPACIMV